MSTLEPVDAAKYLGISKSTLQRWSKEGVVRVIRKGRIVRYEEGDLRSCLDKLKGGGSEKPKGTPATRYDSGTRQNVARSSSEQVKRTLAELRQGARKSTLRSSAATTSKRENVE